MLPLLRNLLFKMSTPSALLQPEILEIIFKNLDGISLWRCENVCTIWKDVLEDYYRRSNPWKACCTKEIPEDVLLQTLDSLHSPGELYRGSINWQAVYRTWYRWRSLETWQYVARIVFIAENRKELITCLRVSGNCVVTGHPNGSIKLWDRYKSFLGKINSHEREVTDLVLMKFKNLVVGCDEWNLKHNLVISTSVDRSILVNYIRVHHSQVAKVSVHNAPTTMVRTYKNCFAVLSKDSRISISRIDGHGALTIFVMRVLVMQEIPECIDIWKGAFSGFTVSGQTFTLNTDPMEGWIPSYSGQLGTKGGRMKKGFIWRNSICAWLSTSNNIHVYSYGNLSRACYNTMPYLMSSPVTLLFYGNVFFLGMESGEVVMYYVETPEDLTKLDLGSYRRRVKLGSDPIVFLDVQETDQGPCVAAATSTSLFCVSFPVSGDTLPGNEASQ